MNGAVATPPSVLGVDVSALSDSSLLDVWRETERLRNRLAAFEQRVIVEAEQRGLPAKYGARDVAALARGVLRVEPREARARVRAADAAVGRASLTGVPCPAPFAVVGAAQQAGDISPRHAAVIVRAVGGLPEQLQAEHGAAIETELVEAARVFDPLELGRLATRRCFLLDQDGALADVAYRARQRGLTITPRVDGSATIHGEATAELTERLLTMLDALAAPGPAADGQKDPRTATQRNHDALLDALDLVTRAELLPDDGGVTTTVVLTTTAAEWDSGSGVVTTGHGALIPVPEARRIAGCDHRAITVVNDQTGAIIGHTDARRLFTENQRHAMAARDGGCSFPGCDTPPAWCQAHHILDWAKGGRTEISNGTLLCGFHHREFEHLGWHVQMPDGAPEWIPPPWLSSTPAQSASRRDESHDRASTYPSTPSPASTPAAWAET